MTTCLWSTLKFDRITTKVPRTPRWNKCFVLYKKNEHQLTVNIRISSPSPLVLQRQLSPTDPPVFWWECGRWSDRPTVEDPVDPHLGHRNSMVDWMIRMHNKDPQWKWGPDGALGHQKICQCENAAVKRWKKKSTSKSIRRFFLGGSVHDSSL